MDEQIRKRRAWIGGAAIVMVVVGVHHYFEDTARHRATETLNEGDTNQKDADGGNSSSAVEISANNKTGTMGIKSSGLSGSVTIPGLDFGKGDMSFEGIKLFPGAKMGEMKLNGSDGESGRIVADFDAPASATAVHDYYAKALADNGFKIDTAKSSVAHIIATKDENNARFNLSLSSLTASSTHGVITIASE